MIKVVITGSIGMGKSTTAKMFVELAGEKWRLYDVDKVVHRLYQKGGDAVAPLSDIFPQAVKEKAIHRPSLAKLVLGDKEKIEKLESIVHPLTRKAQREFLVEAEKNNVEGIVFDIPLFFETGGDKTGFMDYIIVVHSPEEIQRERILQRGTMTLEQLESIKQKQMSSEDKCKKAHFVVETKEGLGHARIQVEKILEKIKKEKTK